MVRVLHVFGGLGTGGTESLIMNWYRNIDRTKVQFDFLVRSADDNYSREITEMGGRIYYTAPFPCHLIRNYKETKDVLMKHEWDVIHVHGNAAMYILPLKLAKKMGYKFRIMHSHNVKAQKSVFSVIHLINRWQLVKYPTHCLACSDAAGKWMFGGGDYQISRNAVDIEDFQFDADARAEIRKVYGLEEQFVVGHVGRFVTQKNHLFLLDVFKELKAIRPDSRLMLVGEGELENEIKAKANDLGISDSIIFTGRRSDVGRIMSAMDIFVLPSIYEGLGIVLVEAQINGLTCIVSEEAYNKEVQILPRLSKVSLSDGARAWADHIQEESQKMQERQIDNTVLESCGYDMRTEVADLEKLYLREAKG